MTAYLPRAFGEINPNPPRLNAGSIVRVICSGLAGPSPRNQRRRIRLARLLQLDTFPGRVTPAVDRPLDYVIIALYLALMVAVGDAFTRFMRNPADYIRGGSRATWWLVGTCLYMGTAARGR